MDVTGKSRSPLAQARVMEPSAQNQEQIAFWNEQVGAKWVRFQELLDRQLEPFGRAVADSLSIDQGDRVLDVGCGCGATSLELARRVGRSGRVVGIDVSAPMLATARQRAAESRADNLEFLQADAQTHGFVPASYTALFSRFGVMFFDDPTAAFRNLRRSLGPGGRLGFVCWQSVAANPWMALPVMVAMQHIPVETPSNPFAPGPFAFADADRVTGLLAEAGYREIAHTALELPIALAGGAPLESVVEFALEIGPLSRALIGTSADVRARVTDGVREALRPYQSDSGIRMASAAWVFRARQHP
jgi:ubiquinone/menaquinone biosynthesis C-methylase UbiE